MCTRFGLVRQFKLNNYYISCKICIIYSSIFDFIIFINYEFWLMYTAHHVMYIIIRISLKMKRVNLWSGQANTVFKFDVVCYRRTESFGKSSPNQLIKIYYIWKLWRVAQGPTLDTLDFSFLIYMENRMAHIGPIFPQI